MIKLHLTEEQNSVIKQQQGLVEVQTEEGTYVLMPMAVYQDLTGNEDLADSAAVLEKRMTETQEGKTTLFTEVLDDLGRKYEVPR